MENRNVYKGHRYVPKIIGEWDTGNQYEGLSIVTYQGKSYTSKKQVPAGIDISNKEYWVVTGNYNAQVEQYRQDVLEFEDEINAKTPQTEFDEFAENTTKQLARTIKKTVIKWADMEDHTEYIQDYLNQGGHIYFEKGTYYVNDDALIIPSHSHVTAHPKAVIKKIPTEKGNYQVFNLRNVENITLDGLHVEGDKYNHLDTTGEWGHGISVARSKNIKIINSSINKMWGDGIYVGEGDYAGGFPCENIRILNNNTSDNSRNGISITHANNVIVDGNTSNYNDRTAPRSGIDLEPNGDLSCVDIKITNNTCNNNNGGILLYKSTDVLVSGNTIIDNEKHPLHITSIKKSRIHTNYVNGGEYGILIRFAEGENKIYNNQVLNVQKGIYVYRTKDYDEIYNNYVVGTRADELALEISNNNEFRANYLKVWGNTFLNFRKAQSSSFNNPNVEGVTIKDNYFEAYTSYFGGRLSLEGNTFKHDSNYTGDDLYKANLWGDTKIINNTFIGPLKIRVQDNVHVFSRNNIYNLKIDSPLFTVIDGSVLSLNDVYNKESNVPISDSNITVTNEVVYEYL